MNILRIFRKSQFSVILAGIILFISCNPIESISNENEQSFNYDIFNEYLIINKTFSSKSLKKKNKSTQFESLVDNINNALGTNYNLTKEAINLIYLESDQILNISMKKGWMTKQDVKLTKAFMHDIQHIGYEFAIYNYEKKVIDLGLTTQEFSKHNLFANAVKSLDYENPNLFIFEPYSEVESPWRCALSILALTAAIGSLGSCITIFACGIAYLLVVNGGYAIADNC